MLVFLRRIPANTTKQDIAEFLEPAMNGKFLNPFSKPGEILNIKIITMKDNDLNAIEQHGVIKIEPDSAAQRVIKKLNRKRLKGKPINVRQYYYRSWHNAREEENGKPKSLKEIQKSNRRRKNVDIIDDIDMNFSSSKKFHRRY